MQKFILLFSLFFSVLRLSAQGPYIPPEKPRLIIGIVIEQFRYDYLEQYWDRLGENGFKRLIHEGTYCKNAAYDYLLTQSGPGYATLSTGASPAVHGIVADRWYKSLSDEQVYCTQDPTVLPLGGSFENGLQSPVHLTSTTFSDELKLASNMKSKVLGVGMQDFTAIFPAGHNPDGVYWYDDASGTLMSSTYYADSLPDWVMDFNDRMIPLQYLGGQWDLSRDRDSYMHAGRDTSAYEKGFGDQSWFPYDLDALSRTSVLSRKRKYDLLPHTPFADAYILDFAREAIRSEELGKDEVTDFLSVSLSASQWIGRRFGPHSLEMEDTFLRLDRMLGDFLDHLLAEVGKKNVLIYLTGAHGLAGIPEVMQEYGMPAGSFKPNQAILLLQSYLNALYSQGDWVKGYEGNQVFLNHSLIEDARLSLSEVQDKSARFMLQFRGIAQAIPSHVVESSYFGSGMMQKVQNGYDSRRSGDLTLVLEPAWVLENDYPTDHSSGYEYDAHVPLIWYGWTVNRSTINRKVYLRDVAPTLSHFCNVPLPNASTGEAVTELYR